MAAPRSRTPLVLGIVGGIACLGLVLLLVIGGIVGFLALRADSEPSDGPTTATSTERSDEGEGDAPDDTTGAGGELVPPPGVAADQPYLELSTSADGPVVDVHLDFLCPHCKTFQETQGEDLAELAQDSTITLRVHPRPMLDASSSPAGYSGRAAHAALCAYAEDPEQWFPAEEALFENQPGSEGLTDEELVEIVNGATGLDISACQAEGAYQPWLQEVVEPDAQATTSGTPTVLIDGTQFTGDLAAPGSVKEAVEAA